MLSIKVHEEELEFLIMDTQHVIEHYERQLKMYGNEPCNKELAHRWRAELLTRKAVLEKLEKAV